MKELNFQTVSENLNNTFMPNQDYKISVFVELWEEHFTEYIQKLQNIIKNQELDKFEKINQLKYIDKEIAQYLIQLSIKDINTIPFNLNINTKYGNKLNNNFYQGYIILPFYSESYTKKDGFKNEYSYFL
jgi:CRISPR-associated endonuclease/helicase Cas3